MPETEIRAVFFDIGNVLLRFDLKKIVKKFVASVGKDPRKLAGFLKARGLVDPIERGVIGPEELYRRFCEAFGYRKSFRSFRLLWSDHFTLNRSTAALMKRVARTRKVYLLSNTNKIHYDFIKERFAFPRQVHGAALSYELGQRKPEPAIFRSALIMAGVAPEEAVFIDDLKENVEAARRLGLRVIHFAGADDLKRRLAALGLLNGGGPGGGRR